MKGLILCGGKGTRLRPFSHSRPKQLFPVANRPVVQYAIEKLARAGIRDIGIVVHSFFKLQFETALGYRCGEASLHYIVQREAKGLADAVNSARSFIGDDSFLLFLGDNFYAEELTDFIRRFNKDRPEALLMVSRVPNPSQFGVVQFDGIRVARVEEKPKNPPSSYAIVGIYLFTPAIFEAIDSLKPSARGEYEITDAIQRMIEAGHTVLAAVTESWWKDTGHPKDLLACNRRIFLELRGECREKDVKIESSTVEGPVVIQAGAEVVDSIIRGPAAIGSGTRIIRSFVGPFTSIGNDVWVEDSEIENSIVLERTRIVNIAKRIDESIIGGEVRMEGNRGYPPSIKVNLGDHSTVWFPFDVE